MSNKIAIFIYQNIAQDLSRVYRGLATAMEFHNAGDDVAIVFDGSGTESLAAIANPSHKLNPLLEATRSLIDGACGFCAGSHGVTDPIAAAGFTLLADNNGEASVRSYVTNGYTILSF